MASIKKWLDVDLNIIGDVLRILEENPDSVFTQQKCKGWGIPTTITKRLNRKHVITLDAPKAIGVGSLDLVEDMAKELPVDPEVWEVMKLREDDGGTDQNAVSMFIYYIRDGLEMKTESLENMVKRQVGLG